MQVPFRKEVRAALAVESVWREVAAVAHELLANGRLDGDEIIRVCEVASRPAPVPDINLPAPPARGTLVKEVIHDRYGRIVRIIEQHEAEPSGATPS